MAWTAPEGCSIGEPCREREGILTHHVQGPFQSGTTKVHVLLPDEVREGESFAQLFVLPVEPFDGQVWGDALAEIRSHELHNLHRLICMMPTFSHSPWYANHPTNPEMRQESHLLQVVRPFIDTSYPVLKEPADRLLLGFSKSGWGAFSLLMRHPDVFGAAAAWDAPLGQATPHKYGMSEVFPDQSTLDKYDVWELMQKQSSLLAGKPRLALLGFGSFRGHHQATHYRMLNLGIAHVYEDGPRREHHWESGWVAGAVEKLMMMRNDSEVER